ncbi:MAG: hypothetical protein PHD29_02195 [bacterium]|nr:hypothetical protein [bacterium]MDD5353697.1 hypothetical protein [bacterium]MDD5755665.1 hypothetical protein [bacterium]
MFSKSKLLLGIIFLLSALQCFAAERPPSMARQDLEWSDYGLNFEWAKDAKLIKELEMNEQQNGEFKALSFDIAKAVAMGEEIASKESTLRSKIPIKNLVKVNGQFVQPDLAAVASLIDQISELWGKQYKIRMSVKAKLRMLLSEKQRDILFNYLKKKELAMREAMREQMGNREGGGRQGMEGMGGMRGGMGGGMGRPGGSF